MKLAHIFVSALTAIGLLTADGCAVQPLSIPYKAQAAAPNSARPTTVKITALAVKQDDTARMLGIDMWRFSIVGPQPAHELTFIVEAQQPGKPARRLVSTRLQPGIGWPMNNHLTVFVGSYPLNDDLRSAAKAKYLIRTEGFRSAPLRELGASTASNVFDNPLNGMAQAETFSGPEQRPDGSFVLTSGTKQDILTQKPADDVALVFRVQEEPY